MAAKGKVTKTVGKPSKPPEMAKPAKTPVADEPLSFQQMLINPDMASSDDVLAMQRVVGNRITSQMLASRGHGPAIQAKLNVGPVNDQYEQEADRIAEQVVGGPGQQTASGAVQRTALDEELQTKPLAASITPAVQRAATEEEEEDFLQKKAETVQRAATEEEQEDLLQEKAETVQRAAEEEEVTSSPAAPSSAGPSSGSSNGSSTGNLASTPNAQSNSGANSSSTSGAPATTNTASPATKNDDELAQAKAKVQRRKDDGSFVAGDDVQNRLKSSKGSGSPLPDDVRTEMESYFGADFSGVKVHTDGESTQLNKDLQAQAFTHGQDIFFNTGKYGPGSASGKKLLAHELTHVVQQTGHKEMSNSSPAQRQEGETIQRFKLFGKKKKKGADKFSGIPSDPEEYLKYLKSNPEAMSDKERALFGIAPKDPKAYIKFLSQNQDTMSDKEKALFGKLSEKANEESSQVDPFHDPYHPTMSPLVNKRPPDKITQEDPFHDPYHPTMSPLVNKRPPDIPEAPELPPFLAPPKTPSKKEGTSKSLAEQLQEQRKKMGMSPKALSIDAGKGAKFKAWAGIKGRAFVKSVPKAAKKTKWGVGSGLKFLAGGTFRSGAWKHASGQDKKTATAPGFEHVESSEKRYFTNKRTGGPKRRVWTPPAKEKDKSESSSDSAEKKVEELQNKVAVLTYRVEQLEKEKV